MTIAKLSTDNPVRLLLALQDLRLGADGRPPGTARFRRMVLFPPVVHQDVQGNEEGAEVHAAPPFGRATVGQQCHK